MSLEDKTIMFVDDTFDSIEHHINALKEKNTNVLNVRTIDAALLQIKARNIDFVIIDLFLPRDFKNVKQYEKQIHLTKNNQGELLGCYLREQQSIPYLYLTSQLGFYQGVEEEKELELCLSKPFDNIGRVIDKIENLLCCQAEGTR